MDLLKLRLREERVLLKMIDEEPDTIVVLGCFNPILRMLGLGPYAPRERPVRPAPAPARRPAFPAPSREDAPRSSGFPWHLLLGLPEKPA